MHPRHEIVVRDSLSISLFGRRCDRTVSEKAEGKWCAMRTAASATAEPHRMYCRGDEYE